MRLRPNIGPIDSTFPLFRPARLRVMARGEGIPAARRDSVLTIEVTNLAPMAVKVTGVYAGYRYTNVLTELTFGKRAPQVALRELVGAAPPPIMLGVGESVAWSANLDQLAEELEENQLSVGPHSLYLYLDLNRIDVNLERGTAGGRVTRRVRNFVAGWSYRRFAVVVKDDQGSLYKTKVRWQPPGGPPPNPRLLSGSRV